MRNLIEHSEIENSQFKAKLEQLCRKVLTRKNIGIDLISVLENKTDVKKIHKIAESQLMRALSIGASAHHDMDLRIIVVSLSLIAMLEYDGNFYDKVRSTYTEVYGSYSEQKVEGTLRDILNKYKKSGTSGSRTRVISVALENAIVPQKFLPAFFEFIFDIYKINFEYDLPDELYEDFKFVYEGLRKNMLSDQDDISINVTKKTYKLIVSTKQLFLREDDLNALIELSSIIADIIDRDFWGKEVKISNPYLKTGYDDWKKQLRETSSQSASERKTEPSKLRSRWEPKFFMENNSIHLVPPIHRVKAEYDYRNIAVEVLNDSKEIYREDDCFIEEIIGGYRIRPSEIEIEKPLGKLAYRLVCGSEIIYDSKERLHRNYIVFNEEGWEINNNTDFEGTAFICHNPGEKVAENIASKKYYCISYKLIRSGDTLRVGQDIFNFSSILKPGVLGLSHKNCFLVRPDEEKVIDVYEKIDILAFEAEDVSNKFEVLINSKPHKLSEMAYKAIPREFITRYVVDLDLQDSGIYTVEVNQIISEGRRNRIFKETFALDSELTYKKETLDDENYRVMMSSGILREGFDSEISASNFEPDFISFDYLGESYSYLLPFDFGFYKINDGDWNSSSSELWIDDVPLESTMLVLNSKYDGLVIYTENGILATDDIVVQDKGFYKSISIGFLNSYKNGNRYVSLVFTVDGVAKYVMRCYNNCVINSDRTEIISLDNPKRVVVTPVFYGKNSIFFEVFNKAGEKIYKSGMLESGQTETLGDFNSFEEYSIKFYEKTKGLTLTKNPLIYQVSRTFYAKEDYVGRVFKIDTIYFQIFIKDEPIERTFHFNKVYVRIMEMINNESFMGEIFIEGLRSPSLYCINPVEIEICSDVVDDTMDVSITNNGDGLLFYDGKILNTLEHKWATDIFSYTLNMKGAVEW
ncbi:MAG: hypothetical protein ACOX75_06710 [Lachnospiraceae bacterium]|jgi:hypothetical protein